MEGAAGVAAAPLPGRHTAALHSRGQPQGSHPLLAVRGWDRHPAGVAGRKCPLPLKIAWEGTGNRNFGPTWKCFQNYQEIRTRAGGAATTLQQNYSSP